MDKEKILILGAAGFIGTNLTLALLEEEKYFLILFDRDKSNFIKKIVDKKESVRIEEGIFTKEYDFLELTKGVDVVYHLISTTCPTNSNQKIAEEIQDNLIPTISLLDACVRNQVRKVIFLSSGGTVYGKEHRGICREEEEAFPISAYGVQKLSIEKILYLYSYLFQVDYRIIRLANPYGPYQKPNGVQGVVTTFVYKALHNEDIQVFGDGSVVRDYIYIEDAIKGIIKITNCDGRNKIYNLGSGKGHSVNDVIAIIRQISNRAFRVCYTESRKVDVPINILDISRYEHDFGSLNALSLEAGIEKTINFVKRMKE